MPNAGWNNVKLVIADVADRILDSWVLIEAGSFVCRDASEVGSPTLSPTMRPSKSPVTEKPTASPTEEPTKSPTNIVRQGARFCLLWFLYHILRFMILRVSF